MHRVVVVALDDVVAFDLAAPLEVFARVRLPDGKAGYEVIVCGVETEVDAGYFRLGAKHGLSALSSADTVILPGVLDIDRPVPAPLVRAVRRAAKAGARILSICSGAFLLAATGLLDGKRATTHWLAADELARRFPRVTVDPSVLYVDEGQVLTSAGAAAAFDLCLHVVRSDYGAAVAAAAARISVVPLERDGGQAQFIERAPPPVEGVSMSRVLEWLEKHLDEALSLEDIARRAAMSVRSLSRHFKQQTGTTPLKWLLRARVRRAQVLLETTPLSIERVASSSGFASSTSLRQHFARVTGTSPHAYRRAFRSRTTPRRLAGSNTRRSPAANDRMAG